MVRAVFRLLLIFTVQFSFLGCATSANPKDSPALQVGDPAPLFKVKTHTNEIFDLSARRGQWTVLYFYPKAGTPGCTTQACAFRDNIKKITSLGAQVYGISTDETETQAKFHTTHRLNFTLLADPKGEVTQSYGSKMAVLNVSKRWTFIIDPQLKIRSIEKDVDPALDADKVAEQIRQFQATK